MTNAARTATARQVADHIHRVTRISSSLASIGISYACVRGPRNTSRWKVSGETYNFRGILKAAGFRWDGQEKAWYAPASTDVSEVAGAILRAAS